MFTPDKGAETARVQCLEAACRTRPQYRPDAHRRGNALNLPCPEVLKLKQTAEKLSRAFGNDDHVRLSKSLQTRRQVRRFTDNAALLRTSRIDHIADDDQPAGDADAGLQRRARLQRRHRCNQFQACSYRPLGIVLMGLWIAKISQHTVAQILRDEPAEAAHDPGGAFVISRNDLAQVFRVHAGRRAQSNRLGPQTPL